ncbi:MAG TPA: class I SAM-dependent methyltransferase [Planctomycetota bacterium]|nr:class I SAM-dependent methyltransferase [Planctomycetota bacterium]
MERIDERRRTSFNERAEQYDAARPGYPEALVRDVLERAGARRIVEVGAGTGKATIAFARAGCEIVALEPGPRLVAFLRRKIAGFPDVRVESTTFEAWSVPDRGFDLVLSAQAFHWVDPAVRYLKAARIAAHLAILTNETAPIDPQLRAAFDHAYTRWTGPGDGNELAGRAVEIARRTWTEDIDRSGLYGPVDVLTVPWKATYTSRDYVALLETYSDHAALDARMRRGLHEAIAGAIDRHGGRIVVPYVALAFVARAR